VYWLQQKVALAATPNYPLRAGFKSEKHGAYYRRTMYRKPAFIGRVPRLCRERHAPGMKKEEKMYMQLTCNKVFVWPH